MLCFHLTWLCPQDAEIEHLMQNLGGGRVFV